MNRTSVLESYRKAYSLLQENLAGIPRECWSFKPSKDQWSIHEIIVHITDSEVNGYVRCRKIIAEPGSTVTAYDQDAWTRLLNYSEQSTEQLLSLFSLIRQLNYGLLSGLDPALWENHVIHPEKGKVTLDDWLKIYDNHISTHIMQIKRNYTAWKDKTNTHVQI